MRKTIDEYEIQGNYGSGWEVVCTEDTKLAAMETARDYRNNEPNAFRIVKKHVPLVTVGITHSIVTEESAEQGDYAEHGWTKENEVVSLYEAESILAEYRPFDSMQIMGDSVNAYSLNYDTNYETGVETSYCVHVSASQKVMETLVKEFSRKGR